MLALCQIRPQPHYRRDAFEQGLRKSGYSLVASGRPEGPQDLLIIWNRYGAAESMANTWERCGGTVLVCENGYAGKDADGRQYYAIAANGHNGSGWWPGGSEDRFARLNLEPQPWRAPGNGHLLICGQRGIGSREMASPSQWHDHVASRLRQQTARRLQIRPHPGNQPPATRLEDDLAGAHACVVWSSSSGVRALLLGYPVFYDAPAWICAGSAVPVRQAKVEEPLRSDLARRAALGRMAWAQWSVPEIESGEPFVRFLDELKTRAAA